MSLLCLIRSCTDLHMEQVVALVKGCSFGERKGVKKSFNVALENRRGWPFAGGSALFQESGSAMDCFVGMPGFSPGYG